MSLNKSHLAVALLFAAMGSSSVLADHAWSDYHWATTTGTVNLPVIDSVTPDWQQSMDVSLQKWNQSNAINQSVVALDDGARTRKRCAAQTGHMRVCNAEYGYNGWAGLASINLDSQRHITQGTAKMNDSYLATYPDDYRNHVMCQEIGHVFGLGHTSEDGSSQKTCMDYSDDINSQWPNSHDYAMLAEIYNHLDSYDTAGGSADGGCKGGPRKCGSNASPAFGVKVMQKGRMQIWVAPGENGTAWVHHVWLAEGYDDIVHDH